MPAINASALEAQWRTSRRISTEPPPSFNSGRDIPFYGGDSKRLRAGLNLKPNHHLTVNLTYDRNRVRLPNGAFTTELVGARFVYGFTPRAFLNAFIQYNANTHLLSSNLRFDLIHHPLSDLYIVYNDTLDTATDQVRGRTLIVKLTNLFNF